VIEPISAPTGIGEFIRRLGGSAALRAGLLFRAAVKTADPSALALRGQGGCLSLSQIRAHP